MLLWLWSAALGFPVQKFSFQLCAFEISVHQRLLAVLSWFGRERLRFAFISGSLLIDLGTVTL